jgi:hypothetical protein
MDKGLDQVRQTIHEKTAPKPPAATTATAEEKPQTEPSAKPNGTNASSAKATRASAKKSSAKRSKK